MKNAQMAGSPLLLLGGAAATLLKGRGALQDIEQQDILKSVCKETYSVSTIRDIACTIREGMKEITPYSCKGIFKLCQRLKRACQVPYL